MTKLLKITATTAIYGALFAIALDAMFQLNLASFANLTAMSIGTGFTHSKIWA